MTMSDVAVINNTDGYMDIVTIYLKKINTPVTLQIFDRSEVKYTSYLSLNLYCKVWVRG